MHFRFKALALNAGRAPLGGPREVGLACFVAARLAAGLLHPLALRVDDRVARTGAARVWLASLALPPSLRAPFTKLMDATRAGEATTRGATAAALVTVTDAAASYLDGPSQAELRALTALLS